MLVKDLPSSAINPSCPLDVLTCFWQLVPCAQPCPNCPERLRFWRASQNIAVWKKYIIFNEITAPGAKRVRRGPRHPGMPIIVLLNLYHTATSSRKNPSLTLIYFCLLLTVRAYIGVFDVITLHTMVLALSLPH
jgi:hypothetical protein